MSSITHRIDVGDVVRGFVDSTDPPKIKRFVVLSVEMPALYFLFNSNVPAFAQAKPEIASQYLPIQDVYTFTDKACFLDCSEIFVFNVASREHEIIINKSEHMGCIDEDLIRRILDSVEGSETLSAKFINRIKRELEAKLQ